MIFVRFNCKAGMWIQGNSLLFFRSVKVCDNDLVKSVEAQIINKAKCALVYKLAGHIIFDYSHVLVVFDLPNPDTATQNHKTNSLNLSGLFWPISAPPCLKFERGLVVQSDSQRVTDNAKIS